VFVISKFDPSKLTVKFMPTASDSRPVEHRRYTLTHSDVTGELFLGVGCYYNLSVINKKLRDEFLAEWIPQKGHYLLKGQVYVSGGEFDESTSIRRFQIFQREAELALSAIFYGDRKFFTFHPQLLDSDKFIQFHSIYPKLNQVLYFGPPRQYMKQI
jgi:hypothetical protein